MPEGAIESRAEQLALMDTIGHDHHTSMEFRSALSSVVDTKTGRIKERAHRNRKKYGQNSMGRLARKVNALPGPFVEELSKATTIGQHEWAKAREAQQFDAFSPYLEKIIALQKQKAGYYRSSEATTAKTDYDALLDDFEPGATADTIGPLFDELNDAIVEMRHKIEKSKAKFLDIGEPEYDTQKQWDFGIGILHEMGFDFNERATRQVCAPLYNRICAHRCAYYHSFESKRPHGSLFINSARRWPCVV